MRFQYLAARLSMVVFTMFGVCSARATDHQLSLDLSPLLDFGHVFDLTPETIQTQFAAQGFKENPYMRWDASHTTATFSEHPFSNIQVSLTAFEEKVQLAGARVSFKENRTQFVILNGITTDEATLSVLRSKLTEALACQPVPGPRPLLGRKSAESGKTSLWEGSKGVALLTAGEYFLNLAIAPPKTPIASLASLPVAREAGSADSSKVEFFVRLDQLLAAPGIWSLTPERFEDTLKMPGTGLKQTPFYKWNTTAKDSVLLTRHVFSNTSTDLLLFDDTVNAEEALIEFRNGKAGKVTLTLLTRGNGGENASSQFEKVFKATGRALGEILKVKPIATVPAGRSLIKTQGYLWTTPHTLALMEFNEEAPKGKLEFLRLKLMPASGRAELLNLAGIGDTVTTKSKASLTSNVKKDASTGDVYIAGVPMIDQGQKGYCVSASCARVFNYLGVKCDQDEIAELVKNDAQKGTRPSDMYSALRKIDQRYNMHVKVVKLPRPYGLEGMRENEILRAQKGDFGKLVQDSVTQGAPLLWAVELPFTPVPVRVGFPGDSPSAQIQDPQSGGGHMRLIIGYNTKTNDIIFTDSWGAGHEIKRMAFSDADRMTQAVFTMQPAQ